MVKQLPTFNAPKKMYIKRFSSNHSLDLVTPEVIDEMTKEEYEAFDSLINKRANKSFSMKFSEKRKEQFTKAFAINIRDYIKDKRFLPRTIFNRRIKEVIAYINMSKMDKLVPAIPLLLDYLKEFFEYYLTNSGKGEIPNVALGLGINKYLKNKSHSRNLQRALKRAQNDIATSGTINKINQKKLWTAYSDTFYDLISGISYKIRDKMKRDTLMSILSEAIGQPSGEEDEDNLAIEDETNEGVA